MFESLLSRRMFLKASLAGAFLLGLENTAFSKVAVDLPLPEGRLSLYNTHSRERVTVDYRDKSGNCSSEAIKTLNRILRCHYTGDVASMDIKVIECLNVIDKKLGGGNEFHIISGYRSPEYNGLLSREGHRVAKQSLHLKGKAIDISMPGVGLDQLRRTALSLKSGGVGYYPGAGFVHIDSGAFRTWGA